jgi:hypothetical protein
MSDDTSQRGPQDRSRINVEEDWEVRWWCVQFNCTEAHLRQAVKKVGVTPESVRKELRK